MTDTAAPDSSARMVRAQLAANLIRLRREKGMSQEALALEAGLHRTFVAHVERQVRNISLDNLTRLADALSVPVYNLLMP
jgi:transcriptional regulator with XRE-family HTH domain